MFIYLQIIKTEFKNVLIDHRLLYSLPKQWDIRIKFDYYCCASLSQIQTLFATVLSQMFQIEMTQINSYSNPQYAPFQSQQKTSIPLRQHQTPNSHHLLFEVNAWSKKRSQESHTTITDCDHQSQRQGQGDSIQMDIQFENENHVTTTHKEKIIFKYKSYSNFQNWTVPKSNYSQLQHHNNRYSNFQVSNQMSSQQLVVSEFTHEEPSTIQKELDPKIKQTPNTSNSDCESSHNLQEQNFAVTARSNCQINQPTPLSINCIQNMDCAPTKKKVEYSLPLKGLYYKNRKTLLKWMRGECFRFQMTRQTYANTAFMMDHYYKTAQFNPNEYLCLALCKLIIASKLNEKKVLYTQKIAKNCQMDVEKMLDSQQAIIKWFKYKMDPYNFARILTQYMLRWDEQIKNNALRDKLPLFLNQSLQSFLIYQQIFFICENHLIENRQLLTSTIQLIFQLVLCSKNQQSQAKGVLKRVFQTQNIFARNQSLYVFEYTPRTQEESRALVENSMKSAKVEFEEKKQTLINSFKDFQASKEKYSIFLNIQF